VKPSGAPPSTCREKGNFTKRGTGGMRRRWPKKAVIRSSEREGGGKAAAGCLKEPPTSSRRRKLREGDGAVRGGRDSRWKAAERKALIVLLRSHAAKEERLGRELKRLQQKKGGGKGCGLEGERGSIEVSVRINRERRWGLCPASSSLKAEGRGTSSGEGGSSTMPGFLLQGSQSSVGGVRETAPGR